MALIIEDGSIVAGAESFVTAAEFVTYADNRGATFPAAEADQEELLRLAIDYLFQQEIRMQGFRISKDQTLMYPRNGVCLYGFQVAGTDIPENLKNAQIEAALYQNENELLVNDAGQDVSKEKLDVLEVSYFSGGSYNSGSFQRVEAYLDPLLRPKSNRLVRF